MMLGLRLVAGFLVWASAFTLLYGGFSLGCALGWDRSFILVLLVVLWLAHVALCALILWRDLHTGAPTSGPMNGQLLLTVVRGSSLAALVATIWTGLPIIVTPPIC